MGRITKSFWLFLKYYLLVQVSINTEIRCVQVGDDSIDKIVGANIAILNELQTRCILMQLMKIKFLLIGKELEEPLGN